MSKVQVLEKVPPEIWLNIFEIGCQITQHDHLEHDLQPCRLGPKPFARLATQTCRTRRDLVTSRGGPSLLWGVYVFTFSHGRSNSEKGERLFKLGAAEFEHQTHDIAIVIKQSGQSSLQRVRDKTLLYIYRFLDSLGSSYVFERVVAIHIHLEEIHISHHLAGCIPYSRASRSRPRRTTIHYQTSLDNPRLKTSEIKLNYNTLNALLTAAHFNAFKDAKSIELVVSDTGIFVPPELDILQITSQVDFFRLSILSLPDAKWTKPPAVRGPVRDFVHHNLIRTSLVTGQEDYVIEPTSSLHGMRTFVISRNDANHAKLFMDDLLKLNHIPKYLLLVEQLVLSRIRCDQTTCDQLYGYFSGLTHLSLDLSKVPFLCLTTLLDEKDDSVLTSLECIDIETASRTAHFLSPRGEADWSEHTAMEVLEVVIKVAKRRSSIPSLDAPLRSLTFDFGIDQASPDLFHSLQVCVRNVTFASEK